MDMKDTTSLKERMTELRAKYEVVLPDTPYIMCMFDGKNFSKLIKNKYKKPFDTKFINIMNEVAKYVCEEIQYSCFAYVQSDEVTVVFSNHSNGTESQNFYGNRISKLLSIIPSLATAKFNQLVFEDLIENYDYTREEIIDLIKNTKLKVFDCKVWTADNFNDVYAYLLWRQQDCIRNSKQQAAQAYFSHKQLHGKDTDEQIVLLKEEKGIDWYTAYEEGMKYGRFIYKEQVPFVSEQYGTYMRNVWKIHEGFPISGNKGRDKLINLNVIPTI